jgi:Putative peptidoglycan binding domain
MSEIAAKRRIARWTAAAFAVTVVAVGETAVAQQAQPDTVFDVSHSLAIEAARTRLELFVEDHPESPDGALPVDLPECPLIAVQGLIDVATTVGSERNADLRLQLDPWLGRTASDPELRSDATPEGEVGGIPIVRCDTARPADGQLTRPAMFAINLTEGVTFGDVIRRYALEGVLTAQPAEVGGRQVGSCLATDETSVCVVLWSSRSLVLGLTLEGPSSAVNTSTAGALLTTAVPIVIDSLAVVTQPAPVCAVDTIGADTGVALISDPLCADGWAFGTTVECPPPPTTTTSTTTTVSDARFASGLQAPPVGDLADCDALDVFHVENDGWVYDGSIDVACTENFTRLGMTAVTAVEVAPEPCDDDDPSLAIESIRPGQQGTRVVALQIALVNLGYVLPVDGRFGPLTEAAVVDFQVRNGIDPIGIAGPRTRAALGI